MGRAETNYDGDQRARLAQVAEAVGNDKAVLVLEGATGELAHHLAARGCRVTEVHHDADAAAAEGVAGAELAGPVTADLDSSSLEDLLTGRDFDVVVLSDLLEQLREPQRVLEQARDLLGEGGQVVVSAANVAHGSVRLALLQGSWRYTHGGLLDPRHLRFFTRSSFVELLSGAGLAVEFLRSTVADPLDVEVDVAADRLPATVIDWVRHQPDALDYRFIASARHAAPEAVGASVPAVVPARPYDEVRRDDEYTDQMREEQATRHRLLNARDELIGLEARVEAAEARLADAEARAERAESRAARIKKRAARRDREMRQSMSWRVGRIVTKPLRLGRRAR